MLIDWRPEDQGTATRLWPSTRVDGRLHPALWVAGASLYDARPTRSPRVDRRGFALQRLRGRVRFPSHRDHPDRPHALRSNQLLPALAGPDRQISTPTDARRRSAGFCSDRRRLRHHGLGLLINGGSPFGDAARGGIFTVVSVITSTGFGNGARSANYVLWRYRRPAGAPAGADGARWHERVDSGRAQDDPIRGADPGHLTRDQAGDPSASGVVDQFRRCALTESVVSGCSPSRRCTFCC